MVNLTAVKPMWIAAALVYKGAVMAETVLLMPIASVAIATSLVMPRSVGVAPAMIRFRTVTKRASIAVDGVPPGASMGQHVWRQEIV